MAKKFVRGITDVKTINNQDYDTNNVNDLLSDGQYNYIHRKKGKNEEYHNLTDNIKTLSSDNTELLAVTNNNKTTNTATLHPKHDAQKEQLLESTRNTVTIHHGTNGTPEKTTVDTNPAKVLEHDNLINEYGISKTQSGNITKLGLLYTPVPNNFDLNTLYNGCIRAGSFKNAPKNNTWFFVSSFVEGDYTIQEAITLIDDKNTTYRRLKNNGVWGLWREQVGDKSVIDSLLAQKEQLLESTRNTVTINRGEKTTVDTNPKKVLEHENLKTGDGLTTSFNTDETTIMFKATKKPPETNLNTLGEGVIWGNGFSIDQVPDGYPELSAAYVTINISDNRKVQFCIRESGVEDGKIRLYYRFIINGEVTKWQKMPGDRGELNYELAQKQDTLVASDGITIDGNTIKPTIIDNYSGDFNDLMFNALVKPSNNATNMPSGADPYGILHVYKIGNTIVQVYYSPEYDNLDSRLYIRTANTHNSIVWKEWYSLQQSLTTNTSIGVDGSGLRQLYTSKQNYTNANGSLKTHVKSVSSNTSVNTPEEEFNFILKIIQGQQSATFTLNEHDKGKFGSIITAYGVDGSVRINGCLFTLTNSTLTVTTEANTGSNYVITFSDII